MAIMSQDPYIFDETIMSNITYGRDGATDAELHAAARMAAIHDDIMAMEKHYDTKIGEGGRYVHEYRTIFCLLTINFPQ
jgi:ABC-type multidrug transport system fused ATPase/permease subunit